MHVSTRAFIALIGIGAVVLGAQWYLTATQANPLTAGPEAFISSMKSVLLASAVLAGGMWLSIKTIFPKRST